MLSRTPAATIPAGRPLSVPGCADLLGQIVANQWQINLVDQLVSHKRGQHPRFEFLQPQLVPFALDQRRLALMELLKPRNHLPLKPAQPLPKIKVIKRISSVCKPGMLPSHPLQHPRTDGRHHRRLNPIPAK
jgi:hypothetical protein